MKNEIISLRRGGDLNSRNLPHGVGSQNLGLRNRTEGTQCNEVSPTRNRAPHLHVPNVVIMDEPTKDKIELNESLSILLR